MTTPKENKWKAPFTRRHNKRNRVIISRDEVEKAQDDYFSGGGKIHYMKADNRPMEDILIHFEDSYL